MRCGDLWARPCVETLGASDRASRASPSALADATFTLASVPGPRRAAKPCHIALAPGRLAMRRTAAEGIAAWRDPSIAGAVAPS